MTTLLRRPKDDELTGLATKIEALTREVAGLRGERNAQQRLAKLEEEKLRLKEEIEDLKLSKERMQEDNDRQVREVEHKVGLERKRQEFEAEQALNRIENERKEAVLEVREANLSAAQEKLEGQMAFMAKRWEEENKALNSMIERLFDRLPDINMALSKEMNGGRE
jgi:chromosome segregation ATPase